MNPRLLIVACVASSMSLLAACGGAKESDLFGSPSGSDLGSSTNGTEPTASSSGDSISGGNGSSGGSSSGGSTSTSSGGSSTSSGGSTSSSGGSSSGATSSSGGSTSSSGGTGSSGVFCGKDQDGEDVVCKTGTSCCAKDTGWGGPSLECTASACQGGLAIKCDDQSDCTGGQICCGTFDENGGYYKAIQCSPTCNNNSGSVHSVRFCDQNAAVDECAQIGKTCQWSGALPGYSVCK